MNKALKSPMRWKTLLAGTAALALAGSFPARAQQSPAGDNVSAVSGAKRLPWEDQAAVVDVRIAALKASLKLTPDQEKNWPAYEAALRNLAKLRVQRYQEKIGEPPRALAAARRRSEQRQRGAKAAGRRRGAAAQ